MILFQNVHFPFLFQVQAGTSSNMLCETGESKELCSVPDVSGEMLNSTSKLQMSHPLLIRLGKFTFSATSVCRVSKCLDIIAY